MKVIVLCGSTRFKKEFEEINKKLSLEGNIVISLPFFEKSSEEKLTVGEKKILTAVHMAKIDICDEIYVIDGWIKQVGHYVGRATEEEIDYARSIGKRVRHWSTDEIG